MTLLSILAYLNNAVVWMVSNILLFLSFLVYLSILWRLFQVHQLQLVSPSHSFFIVFFLFPSQVPRIHLSFRFLLILRCDLQSPLFGKFSTFLLIITRSVRLGKIRGSICFLKSFIIITSIIIPLFWEFFKLALADGFSLEFEWQQISSSLWYSSMYSGRS